MRHRKRVPKLGKTVSHRKAMFNNMVTSLFIHEKLLTTEAKAKELVKLVARLITFAKQGNLHARRQVLVYIKNKEVVKKLFDVLAPRFENRQGGYTRIVKVGDRKGDGAQMAVVELLPEEKS